MTHRNWKIVSLCIAAACLALAGCPWQPLLFVSPLAVNFGPTSTTQTFRIYNAGGGMLSWEVSEELPWLTLVEKTAGKQGAILQGTTTTEIDVIEMRIDRTALVGANASGQVLITSNGGNQTVAVSATVAATAQLQVSPTFLDFGDSLSTAQLTLTNLGLEALNWQLTVSPDSPWLSATPTEGTLSSQGATAAVTVTANRAALPPGAFQGLISFTSNGGDVQVIAAIETPVLFVLPDSLAFGVLASPTSRLVTLQNQGLDPIPWTATANAAGGWLSVTPSSGNVPAGATQQINVTASPTGLAPGAYSGEVVVAAAGLGFTKAIPVTMSVSGFVVSRSHIAFGVIEQAASDTFAITNTGATPIPWQIQKPAAATWLNVSPASGTLTASETITVTADPTVVAAGQYDVNLSILHDDATEIVRVTMTRPAPPALVVAPTEIDFSTTRVEQTLAIWNPGTGTVGWRIDTTGFPAWLSLTPAVGGIASGTVTGDETAILAVRVDRDQAPPGSLNFSHTFAVEAVSGASGSVEVLVRMTIPVTPRIEIEADGFDSTGIPFVNLDVDENAVTFKISNVGNGALFWSISGQEQAEWITSVAPAQGTLDPNTQITVTISVDRRTLTYLGAQHLLTITSNDPNTGVALLLVEIQVAKVISVATRPQQLAFGVDVISDVLEVANFGDPDTVLNFAVTSNKEWLNVFPDSGTSIGTPTTIKDWQPISVTVDRSLIDGVGASAKLTVTAFQVVDGQRVPLPGVAPIEVPVSVEAVELSFESARPRLRVPSLVRTVLLMRNIRQQVLPIPDALLGEVARKFTIYEKGEPLEITETNQFLRSANRIRANVMILLDYSGSMLSAARQAVEPEIANAEDPIQALYESCIPQLINELPDHYRIALAVMSERIGDGSELSSLRLLGGDDGEEVFTTNKAVLEARLFALDVNDNGATTLLPTLQAAANVLLAEDLDENRIPFDDADMRAIIAVTDGRLTTSSNLSIPDTALHLLERHVRYMPVGWGLQVAADPLIRLSYVTGGHYYATRNVPTGEVDAFGNAVRVPVASTLRAWCETDLADDCDQSIARDLKSQVVLNYSTLKNEANVVVQGRLTFNDPNDQNSPCLPEQGDISGSFSHTQLDFQAISGDPRLGQVSLRTDGLEGDGTARVVVRLEYAPRNLRRIAFSFQVDSVEPYAVNIVKVAESAGGVFPTWTQSGALANLAFATPDNTPLQYGDFGDMFELRFSNVTLPFTVHAAVTDPVIVPANPESKYFTIPDSIYVGATRFLAPAFPTPLISSVPQMTLGADDARIIDLGTAIDAAQISIWNGGGSHAPTGVWLDWFLNIEEGAGFVSVVPLEGTVVSTLTPDLITATVNRAQAPGDYRVVLGFSYVYGSLGLTFLGKPITLLFTVTDAALEVTPTVFAFGDVTVDLPVTVSNTGQGVLRWSINTAALPAWLVVTQGSGVLGPGESNNFLVRVLRDQAPGPGDHLHTFLLETDIGQSVQLTATMTVNP